YVYGGTVSTPNIKLGVTAGKTGTYTQTAGTVNAANIYVGGNDTASGGTGLFNMSAGSLSVTSTPHASTSPPTPLNLPPPPLSAGAVQAGALDVPGATFNWTGGSLKFTNPTVANPLIGLSSSTAPAGLLFQSAHGLILNALTVNGTAQFLANGSASGTTRLST